MPAEMPAAQAGPLALTAPIRTVRPLRVTVIPAPAAAPFRAIRSLPAGAGAM